MTTEPDTDLATRDKFVRAVDVPSKHWREHSAPDTSTQQTAPVADVVVAASVQVTPKQQADDSNHDSKHTSSDQQVLGTADRPTMHVGDDQQLQPPPHKKQRYVDGHKPPEEPSSQLQQEEPKVLQQQQQQQQIVQEQLPALPQPKGLPPLPQQQHPTNCHQREPSPEARRAGTVPAAAGDGGSTAVAAGAGASGARRSKERSSSGQLLSPAAASSGLLGLQDLLSPTPYAPKYYISNDGTIAVVRQHQQQQQHKRLSLSIPAEDPAPAVAAAAAAGGSGGQSPVANMMASLLAETATARAPSIAITPWGNPPAISGLFSPTAAGTLDAAGNTLVSPRVTAGPAVVNSRLGSLELQHSQELLGPATGLQGPGAATHPAGRKRPLDASLLDPRCAEVCNAAQAAAMGSCRSGVSDLAALQQWQQTIEAAEQQWGSSHPAVGRAWLELARVWQATDKESDRAKYATKKAFDICQILLKQTAMESHAQESFQYLLEKFNRKSTAAKQAQQAAASAAMEAAAAALAPLSATAAAVAPPGFNGFAQVAPVHPGLQQHYQQFPTIAFVPGMYMPPEAGDMCMQQGAPAGYGAPVYHPIGSIPNLQQAGDADSVHHVGSQGNTATTLHAGVQHRRDLPATAEPVASAPGDGVSAGDAGGMGGAAGGATPETATARVPGA